MVETFKERIEREIRLVDHQISRYHYVGWSHDHHLLEWRHFLMEGLLKIQIEEFDYEHST